MKLSPRYFAIGIAALLVTMTGCSSDQFPTYSTSLKYPPRKDPIVAPAAAAKLGDERFDPDTPGQLPLMSLDDIFKPGNPFHPKAEEIKTGQFLRDPTKFNKQKELEDALEENFGTPANPKVAGLDPETVKILKIDDSTLAEGSKRYRVHCLHCHGLSGDGRGPTAKWINPHPRDFRAGLFKFQSISQVDSKPGAPVPHSLGVRPPARADLLRTLRHGIEGTAMP
ncbi:MAG TPA: hypothetical protein VFE62_14835, partial [Gemmataceae bacterium]|nr:hypothetical protein [Gemmataceae bacterium]